MAVTFTFELVTPERLVVSRQAVMVTVPGGEGDYTVLAGHAPLITTVKAGMIDIYDSENGNPVESIAIGDGFAEVTQTRCTVLAEQPAAAPKAAA